MGLTNFKGAHPAKQETEIAKNYLKRGRSIIVFPEGHRSEDGKVKRFKKIPFQLQFQGRSRYQSSNPNGPKIPREAGNCVLGNICWIVLGTVVSFDG